MKFSEIPYVRPDFAAAKAFYAEAAGRLRAASGFAAAEAVFLEAEEFAAGLETALAVAEIRRDMDTRDPFYAGESAFIDRLRPELREYEQLFEDALLATPFRAEFEAKYGRMMFTGAEISRRAFTGALVAPMQRENALCSEYSRLLASAQIPFEGGACTLSQLTPFKRDPSRERRAAAWAAEDAWYASHAERLDSLYAELVELRGGMGRALGHADFIPLGYDLMGRCCYGPGEVARFRAAVLEHVVPAAERACAIAAERLGLRLPIGYADSDVWFAGGNARPAGSSGQILAAARRFYHELSGETAEFIDFMLDGGYLDVLSRPGKASGGYCTSLPSLGAPFIFANFNGTSGDVDVMTHEAGHAFAAYTARNIVPLACRSPGYEACEVHSIGMEYFAEAWAGAFFGEAADRYRWQHLAAALAFIPYGALVDHFQHECYRRPDMTPARRNALWLELQRAYMPWLKPEAELGYLASGRAWQRQRHIYQYPLYYIDYCLAQAVALQFARLISEEGPAAAWRRYMAYSLPGGTRSFLELVALAGLRSPFDPAALEQTAAWALSRLEASAP